MNGTRDGTVPALCESGPGAGLELIEAPVPCPGAGEVLVRVPLAGICGTDLHTVDWDGWARSSVRTPLIPGHECVGRIVGTGSGVSGLREGQTVGVEGHLTCGRCAQCRSGARRLCLNNTNLGVHTDGVFARYVVVPAAADSSTQELREAGDTPTVSAGGRNGWFESRHGFHPSELQAFLS